MSRRVQVTRKRFLSMAFAVRCDSAAAYVLVTGLVGGVDLLVCQTGATVFQRGADIPSRSLDGGQAADDRSDRAVFGGGLARFCEVPGIFGGLGSVRLLLGPRGWLFLGRR